MKDVSTKVLCGFIGWNYKLLSECSVASKKCLHKYAGAVILLMLIWAYIGYGMADRYFKVEETSIKVLVAALFMFVIWLIERQIILIVGKNRAAACFRIALAVIMACIGATIIDQTIFGKDIEAQKERVATDDTKDLVKDRTQIIQSQRSAYRTEIDSLETLSAVLTSEINKQPNIYTWTRNAVGVDSAGLPIYATNQATMPNPKIRDRDRINARIDELQKGLDNSFNELQVLQESILKENKDNFGIMRELEIVFSNKVILSSWVSMTFYMLVFIFFLIIECLVVTGKVFSKKCDYEILVERQQDRKIHQINSILPLEK